MHNVQENRLYISITRLVKYAGKLVNENKAYIGYVKVIPDKVCIVRK